MNILRHIAPVAPVPALVLTLAGIGIYANSLQGPFVFDDYAAIVHNGDIRELWPLWRAPEASERPSINSRPLVRLSLALNYTLGGLETAGYHAVNIALHIGCALVFYAVLARSSANSGLAFCGALLWLAHPLNTQVVNYITQRSESLMALCYLGTLYCAARRGAGWSVGAVVCCGLGMVSKEVMVTAPVAVWLYDRAWGAGSLFGALRMRPYLYAGLVACWGIIVSLMASGPHGDSVGFARGVGPFQYLTNQCEVVVGYLGKFAWPDPLLLDYGRPQVLAAGAVWPQVTLLLLLVGGSVWLAWRRPQVGFCALFFFLVLAPTSSVVPVVGEVGADRRVYLPLCGLCALVAAADRWRGWVLAGAGVLAMIAIGRNEVYRDPVVLWRADVAALPGNYRAHNNLGQALLEAGRIREAVPHFHRALEMEPGFAEAHNNLGLALAGLGHSDQASKHYRRALVENPGYASAHNNLGMVLVAAGDSSGALRHFRQAIAIDPDFATGYNNLGLLLAGEGDRQGAEAHYRRALSAHPDYGEAHVNWGLLLAEAGQWEQALEHYRRAVAVEPDLVEAHFNLGTALEETGRAIEAERAYRAALALDSMRYQVPYRLGQLVAAHGRVAEGLAQLRRALALDPEQAQVHFHIGRLLVRADSLAQGVAHYRRALEVAPKMVEGHYNLGTVLLRQGRAEEALPYLQAVAALQPQLASARNNLGIALQLVGRSDEALAEFRRAVELRPDYADARENIAAAMRAVR